MLPGSGEVEGAYGNGEIGESSWTILWMRPWGIADHVGAIHVCNKLTCDVAFIVFIPTLLHVQLLERHASKGPDVAWGSGGGGKT